jgi:hypothetical protein
MVMPPPAYIQARRRAPYHLQVELQPQEIVGAPGPVRLSGTVVKVFRGRGLSVGSEVSLDLHVYRTRDELYPGGARWLAAEELRSTCYIELYGWREPTGLTIAGRGGCWNSIPQSTNAPTMPRPGFLESLLAWRRWRAGKLVAR